MKSYAFVGENDSSTVRTIRITRKTHLETSDNSPVHFGPECDVLELEGVNCAVPEFFEWLDGIDELACLCPSGEAALIDLGSCLELGCESLISISFDYWFSRHLAWRCNIAKWRIHKQTERALEQLDKLYEEAMSAL